MRSESGGKDRHQAVLASKVKWAKGCRQEDEGQERDDGDTQSCEGGGGRLGRRDR